MEYISTRGEAPVLGFEDAMLAGLARDGGLYLPRAYPQFTAAQIEALRGGSYQETAFAVMRAFTGGSLDDPTLREMIDAAYSSFRHPAVTPLVQTGAGEWLLDLHRGPTLAFKDVAMQILARMMDHALDRREARATVVCATSGDTGGAAVDAFAGRERSDLFVLLPKGRVSEVQRRIMTTSGAANVHALEIDGNFDDCQALVKGMFNDHPFRERMGLSGVNSINWARVMAQAVYYFTASVALGAPHIPVSFTVPTGNFGDILAGYVAKRMGVPIERLVVATNVNDILARTFIDGRHETSGVVATSSPSMDIQISSNFERLLFELLGRDGAMVRSLMEGLKQSGGFTMPADALDGLRREFSAGRADEDETAAMIRTLHREGGLVVDPHTAVGYHVARSSGGGRQTPMVVLSTAHPAKFPDAVEAAIGMRPELPDSMADLYDRPEQLTPLPNDIAAVKSHIAANARIVGTARAGATA